MKKIVLGFLMVFVVGCTKDKIINGVPTTNIYTPSNITSTTATIYSEITSNGGAPISESGVIWSTSNDPTIDLITKKNDASNTGIYVISELASFTTYFVRAYATNSFGTAYSNEISFVTLKPTEITIGTQTWMTKNLNVSTYSDGTEIPEVKDASQWINLTTGAWCYYGNNIKNGDFYGKLYNWYAVAGIYDEGSKTDISKRKKLAPNGWHVPSSTELYSLNLNDFFNGGGGSRAQSLGFYNIGADCSWWSNTEWQFYSTEVMYRKSVFLTALMSGYHRPKADGLYVRCIKD